MGRPTSCQLEDDKHSDLTSQSQTPNNITTFGKDHDVHLRARGKGDFFGGGWQVSSGGLMGLDGVWSSTDDGLCH